jgi:MFS family permease
LWLRPFASRRSPLTGPKWAVWGTAAGGFLVRAGFGLILPALPEYVHQHGLAIPDLGLASAFYLGCSVAGMLLVAPLVDRVGHTKGLVAGGALYVIGTFLLLLVPSSLGLFAGRGLQGLAMSLYTPAVFGYVGTTVSAERRGGAYGTIASAQMAGFLLGPTVGGVALGLDGPGGCLVLAAGAAVATLAVTLLLPPEAAAHHPLPAPAQSVLTAFTGPLRVLLAAPWGLAFLAYTIGQQVPNGVYQAVWSLYMFHLGAAPWLVGVSYATWALPLVLLAPWFGRRAVGVAVRTGMIVGGSVMGLAAFTYAMLTSPYAMAGVGLLEGIGAAIVLPLSQVYLAERVPSNRMAGTQAVATGLGQSVGLAGAVVSGFAFPIKPWLPFVLVGICLLGGTWAFALVRESLSGRIRSVASEALPAPSGE